MPTNLCTGVDGPVEWRSSIQVPKTREIRAQFGGDDATGSEFLETYRQLWLNPEFGGISRIGQWEQRKPSHSVYDYLMLIRQPADLFLAREDIVGGVGSRCHSAEILILGCEYDGLLGLKGKSEMGSQSEEK